MRYLLAIAATISLLQPAFAGDGKTCKHHGPGEDIYKHYKGAVGDHKIILDLRYGFCGSSNYGGSYIHDLTTGITTQLIIREPRSFAHDAELMASEYDINGSYFGSDMPPISTWHFSISGTSLKGTFKYQHDETDHPLELAEDNTAIPFEVSVFSDSAKTMRPGKPMFTAYYEYIGTQATGSSASVNQYILQLTGGKTLGATNMDELPSVLAQKSYTEFNTMYQSLPGDTSNVAWKGRHIHDYYTIVFPAYNNNDIVSLECLKYGEKSSHSSISIDTRSNKQFTATSVFGKNTDKALVVVKEEYNKHPTKGLEANSLTITDDFILTAGGIIFCYTSADEYPEERRLFIPYTRLSPILSTDFKKRMNL